MMNFVGSGRNVVTFSFGLLSLFAKLVLMFTKRDLKASATFTKFITVYHPL